MLQKLLLVGAGGFLGSIMRYTSGYLLGKIFESNHPAGTFLVNVLGSFFLGIVIGFFNNQSAVAQNWKLFLAVGFCGGFTTFSAFALENITYIQSQQTIFFLLYTGLSLMFGLAAVYAGLWLVK